MSQWLIALLVVYTLLLPAHVSANAQSAQNAELSAFAAVMTAPGIAIEWQANGAGVDWNFTLYRSQNCQFEGAEEVVAPIFSSINDETQSAFYTLTDTEEFAVTTCAYWLVATESDGKTQHFGPYQVEGRSVVYLPLALK